MPWILKVYLQIICLDMIHHIHDGEVSGPAPRIVFNLLRELIYPMGSTSLVSRAWEQGVWKGMMDSGLEDTVVLEVELGCSPMTLSAPFSVSASLSSSLVKFLYPARPPANFLQITPHPRLPGFQKAPSHYHPSPFPEGSSCLRFEETWLNSFTPRCEKLIATSSLCVVQLQQTSI